MTLSQDSRPIHVPKPDMSSTPLERARLLPTLPAQSVVLHSLTLSNVASDFSVPIGMKCSGVDNTAYSLTGEAFSHVVPPNSSTSTARVMQSDDVALGAPPLQSPRVRLTPIDRC